MRAENLLLLAKDLLSIQARGVPCISGPRPYSPVDSFVGLIPGNRSALRMMCSIDSTSSPPGVVGSFRSETSAFRLAEMERLSLRLMVKFVLPSYLVK